MKQISFTKGAKKPCAICHSKAHKGYLTAAAVKEHQCCERNFRNLSMITGSRRNVRNLRRKQ